VVDEVQLEVVLAYCRQCVDFRATTLPIKRCLVHTMLQP